MKKVSLFFALFLGFAAASFAQTAPTGRWETQETSVQLTDGTNAVRMADGSVVRLNIQGGEVFNLSVQKGREKIIFDGNDAIPADAPQGRRDIFKDVKYCYYSTKHNTIICMTGPVFGPAPSKDPTNPDGQTKEHILLARQIGVPMNN